MNDASGIRLTHLDARLTEVVLESLRQAELLTDAGRALGNALDSPRVVSAEAILPEMITMNSTVILEDRASGKRKKATVVHPATPIRRTASSRSSHPRAGRCWV